MTEPIFTTRQGKDLDLPGNLLAETAELYDDAARDLFALIREMKAAAKGASNAGARTGEPKAAREAQSAVRDLKAAFQMAIEERNRVEKLGREAAGNIRDRTLDFDDARAEIGRRLARLRL